MKLSDMRNKVQILKATVDIDQTGNRVNSYASYCVRWAYINKTSGGENYEAGITHENEVLKIVIRYDSMTRFITPGEYRINFSGKEYDILSVDNYKYKNESLTINAEEIS